MLETLGGIIVAVFVAVVSGLILDWWSGWRGKAWLATRLQSLFRRICSRRSTHSLLIFVSSGGTCRDPMAKAIAEKLIKDGVPELKGLRVEGRARMKSPSKSEVSHAARVAIRDLLGEDRLVDYVPASITQAEIERADLILVMSRDLLRKGVLPTNKTYLFKEFFGLDGDIRDPWPDGRDQNTLARYRECAEEIKVVMESGMGRLVRALRR